MAGVAACDIDGDGKEEIYFLNTNQAYAGVSDYGDKIFKWRNGHYENLYSDPVNIDLPAKGYAGRSVACIDRHGTGKYGFALATYSSRGQGKYYISLFTKQQQNFRLVQIESICRQQNLNLFWKG